MKKISQKKCRICRRLGEKLFLKGKRCYNNCPIDRKGAIPPGQHGRRYSRPSPYELQLKEKQKLRAIYGLSEAQLRNALEKARQMKEETDLALLQLLERRLDSVLFSLGFVPNRRTGRQLIAHGKVKVNNEKVTIPSYKVQVGQVITLDQDIKNIPQVKKTLEEDIVVPEWLKRKGIVGTLKRLPTEEEIDSEADITQIIAFYSR